MFQGFKRTAIAHQARPKEQIGSSEQADEAWRSLYEISNSRLLVIYMALPANNRHAISSVSWQYEVWAANDSECPGGACYTEPSHSISYSNCWHSGIQSPSSRWSLFVGCNVGTWNGSQFVADDSWLKSKESRSTTTWSILASSPNRCHCCLTLHICGLNENFFHGCLNFAGEAREEREEHGAHWAFKVHWEGHRGTHTLIPEYDSHAYWWGQYLAGHFLLHMMYSIHNDAKFDRQATLPLRLHLRNKSTNLLIPSSHRPW